MALKVSDGTSTYVVSPTQMGQTPDAQIAVASFQDVAQYCAALPWLRVTDGSLGVDVLLATSRIVKIWRDAT